MMMLRLSRRTVRHTWPPYVGALVALACGVALLVTAISVGVAVDRTLHRSGVSAQDRTALSDLSAMVGIMSSVALFMAVFVVGSTFGFVVATRRRQLGLLRLVGATPRQVRRMVVGEAAIVAVLAAVVGCLLGSVATPAFLGLLEWRGLLPVELTTPSPWLAWAFAAPGGVVVAVLGSWRSSKRAAKVSPVAAFQEAAAERRRPGAWQLVIGTLCVAGAVTAFALTRGTSPVFAVVTSVLMPEVLVLGLYCFGGWIFPSLASLVARPFVGRDVSARVARDHVRTSVRMPVSLGAPILAISAIAGSMILSLSLTADWTTGLDREQLATPYVVETGHDRVGERLEDLPLADPRVVVTLPVGAEHEPEQVEVVDPATAGRARGMRIVEGALTSLDHGVAISASWETDSGVHLGDRLLGARVVAVVRDAPDLYGDIIVGPDLVPEALRDTAPESFFVDPGDADLEQLLSGTDARILTADAWIDEVDQQTRAGNNVGLWVLLGPAGLYAAIAIVNSVLIGASQRRTQLRTLELLGATQGQLRRMALWEAGVVGAAALLVGAGVTGVVGWTVRSATAADVAALPLTLPWLPLSAIVVTCGALTMVAAFAGARAQPTRRTSG